MNAALAGLCGVLFCAGLLAVAQALRGPRKTSGAVGRPRLPGLPGPVLRHPWRLLAAVVIGAGLAGWTGWSLLVVLVPALAVGLPAALSAPVNTELVLLEALDRWVRSLASLLPTGRSISDALRTSVRQAPADLAPGLGRLSHRLDARWPVDQALLALADELASPDADAVLAALALAARRGGTGAVTTLGALADNVQDRLRALREIETERAKPRIVVRQVTSITLVVLGLAFVFGGGFFAPYASALGQALLATLVAAYLGSLLMLRHLVLPRPRARILRRSA